MFPGGEPGQALGAYFPGPPSTLETLPPGPALPQPLCAQASCSGLVGSGRSLARGAGRMKAKDTGPPEGASLHRCPHPPSAQPRPPAARAPADRLASPGRPLSPECGSWPKLDLTQLSARPSLPF